MNEIQQIELELLKIFVAFCEKHNLKYFLVGGTALGAVRHGGFIPWDDDIDVGMPREDYDRFLELADEDLTNDSTFLQTYKSDPNFIYNFAKLRKNGTTYVEYLFRYTNIHHGVWIDIFPIDGLSKDEKPNMRKMRNKIYRTWFHTLSAFGRCGTRKISKKHFFKDLFANMWWYLEIFIFDLFKVQQKINDKIMKKIPYKDATYVANIQGAWFEKEIIPKAYFGEGVMTTFEDLEVRIPAMSDEFLTHMYGDYMKLPEEEKRIAKHKTDGIDLHMSSYEYRKNYKVR